MMGTIGEQHRMDGTVISDAVNLASRVESLTKTYRIGLLISQHTYDRLADPKAYDIRPIDVVVVKGKSKPVTLFEVFQRNDPAERAAKGGPATFCCPASRPWCVTIQRPPASAFSRAWRSFRAIPLRRTC